MQNRHLGFALLIVFLQTIAMSAFALERTALVVGNGAYRDAPLRNPVNDATDVAQVLEKQLGFEVILRTDVTQQQFDAAARDFRQRLQRRGGVGLFYYAGHGIQADGHNYLIPVGANIDSETDVKYKAVDAGYVVGQMDEANATLNIVVLDACRDNPYERSFRSDSRGLVRLEMPAGELGSLLAYSTAPGKVAADGRGRNSPYTAQLVKALKTPNLTLEQVFKKVAIAVYKQTNHRQKSWTSQFLLGDFYFLGAQPTAIAKAPPKATPSPAEPLAQTPEPSSKRPTETWTEPITGMEFVWIPKGCDDIGSPKTEEGRKEFSFLGNTHWYSARSENPL